MQHLELTKGTLNEGEAFVRAMVERIVPKPMRRGRGRPAVLPTLCLWSGFQVESYAGWAP